MTKLQYFFSLGPLWFGFGFSRRFWISPLLRWAWLRYSAMTPFTPRSSSQGDGRPGEKETQMALEATERLAGPPAQNPNRELLKTEREIAQRFKGGVPWGAVLGAWELCVLAGALALDIGRILPLWLGFVLATLSVTLCYLPSHEAQHEL